MTRNSIRRTALRTASLTLSTVLAVPLAMLAGSGVAHADGPGHSGVQGQIPVTRVDFGPDEGSQFTVWDNGNVSTGTAHDAANRDAIQSEGTIPLDEGDFGQFLWKELTGTDLPVVSFQSWLADKVIESIDFILGTSWGPAAPAPAEPPVDGGTPPGGTSQADPTPTDATPPMAMADNSGADKDKDKDKEQDPTPPECPDCPDETGIPQPDSDTEGPHGPAVFDPSVLVAQPTDDGGPVNPYTQLAQPTDDGGPVSPYTQLVQPTDDGTGPTSPVSLIGSHVGALMGLR
jgi:hypothetical protein